MANYTNNLQPIDKLLCRTASFLLRTMDENQDWQIAVESLFAMANYGDSALIENGDSDLFDQWADNCPHTDETVRDLSRLMADIYLEAAEDELHQQLQITEEERRYNRES